MKKWMFATSVAILLMAGTILAHAGRYYLMCSHTSHDEGRYARVGGSYDDSDPCWAEAKTHKANHGTGGKHFTVQCSYRTTPPDE